MKEPDQPVGVFCNTHQNGPYRFYQRVASRVAGGQAGDEERGKETCVSNEDNNNIQLNEKAGNSNIEELDPGHCDRSSASFGYSHGVQLANGHSSGPQTAQEGHKRQISPLLSGCRRRLFLHFNKALGGNRARWTSPSADNKPKMKRLLFRRRKSAHDTIESICAGKEPSAGQSEDSAPNRFVRSPSAGQIDFSKFVSVDALQETSGAESNAERDEHGMIAYNSSILTAGTEPPLAQADQIPPMKSSGQRPGCSSSADSSLDNGHNQCSSGAQLDAIMDGKSSKVDSGQLSYNDNVISGQFSSNNVTSGQLSSNRSVTSEQLSSNAVASVQLSSSSNVTSGERRVASGHSLTNGDPEVIPMRPVTNGHSGVASASTREVTNGHSVSSIRRETSGDSEFSSVHRTTITNSEVNSYHRLTNGDASVHRDTPVFTNNNLQQTTNSVGSSDGCENDAVQTVADSVITNVSATAALHHFQKSHNRTCTSFRIKIPQLKNPVDACLLHDDYMAIADYDNGFLIVNAFGDVLQHRRSPNDTNACGVACSQSQGRLFVLIVRDGRWSVHTYNHNFSLVEIARCPIDIQIETWALRRLVVSMDTCLHLMASGESKSCIWVYELDKCEWKSVLVEVSGKRNTTYNDMSVKHHADLKETHILLCEWKKAQLWTLTVDEKGAVAEQKSIKMKRVKGQEWIVQGPHLAILDEQGDMVCYDGSGKLFLFDGETYRLKKIIADVGRGEVSALAVANGWVYALCRYRLCFEAYLYREQNETDL